MSTSVKIAKCAVKGVYHDFISLPCQDAVGSYVDGNYTCICLCDGCGSVENSELASKFICDNLPKYLCHNFDYFYNLEDEMIASKLIEDMKSQASEEGIKLDCTMLTVVSDGEKEIILHIGDGIIIAQDMICEGISLPENGDEDNETYYLSGKEAFKHLRIKRASNKAYFLTSDGISYLIYSNGSVLPAVDIMLNWLRDNDEKAVEKQCLSEIERLFKQRSNDDISIVMMYKI